MGLGPEHNGSWHQEEKWADNFASFPRMAYDSAANVDCDGYGVTLRPPFVPSQLAEAGAPRPCSVPYIMGKRIPNMITGTVKFFNADKGYGFITPESGGADAFVHISAVERAGMQTLDKDQRVSYELEKDQRGKMSAVNLQSA
jgi:CspA family cold shock protein